MIAEIALDMFRGNLSPCQFFSPFSIAVGERSALSTTSARELAISRCLLQKPHKQRLPGQIHMATSSAFTLAASHGRHHEFKGREINDLQKWRRGWDLNPR